MEEKNEKKDKKEEEEEEEGEVKDPKEKKKRKGLFFKAKKNMSEKFITSKTGKKVINKVLDDEMKELILTVKEIIAVETGKKEVWEK